MIDKEMMKALEADGEKLRQLTGEDHGPQFPDITDHTFTPAQSAQVRTAAIEECAALMRRWRDEAAEFNDDRCRQQANLCQNAAVAISNLAAQPPAAPIETDDEDDASYERGFKAGYEVATGQNGPRPHPSAGSDALPEPPSALTADDRDQDRAQLRSTSAATQQATGRYEFPYQRTFDAIAAATSIYAEGVGINVSVKAFQEAFNSHRDARPLAQPQGACKS